MTTTTSTIEEMPVTFIPPPITPGADWEWSFQKLDLNRNPENTTGYSARLQLRTSVNGDLVKELNTTTSGITHTPASGLFEIRYTAADTASISVSKLVYDVFVTTTTRTYCILKGEVKVNNRVTK